MRICNMRKWNELSITEKVPYLKLALDSGITDLNTVHNVYNKYADGGEKDQTPMYLRRPEPSNYNYSYESLPQFKDFMENGPTEPPSEVSTNRYKVLDRNAKQYLRQKASEVASLMEREIKQKAIDNLKSMDKNSIKEIQTKLAEAGGFDKSLEGISKSKTKELQSLLVRKGYLDNRKNSDGRYIEVDGIVGEKTISAYNRYNRDKNIDGIVGPRTINAYLKYNNIGQTNYDRNVTTQGIDGCAQWVTKKYEDAVGMYSKQNGVTLNAWQMPQNIVNHGGQMIYNIYDDSFNNVKDISTLKNKTEQALKKNPIDYSLLQVGDVVGIYLPSSNMHTTALKEGTTKNTHIGIVTKFDKDGMPIIEHNIHTSHRVDRADKLTGSLFGKAQIATVARPKMVGKSIQEIPFESKPSRFELSDEYKNENMTRFMDSMEGAAPIISTLFPQADINEVMKAAIGVQKRETNFMTNRVSDQIDNMSWYEYLNPLSPYYNNKVRKVARYLSGKNEETQSSNMSKFKLSSLNMDERKLLGINSVEDLENPEKAGIASLFTLAKNYDYFKRLQKTYPDLGITNNDILSLTILSYNQGMSKLWDIGFDRKTGKAAPEELQSIRNMSKRDAKVKDINSTNYKHFKTLGMKKIGEFLYNLQDEEDQYYTPYISSGLSAIEDYIKEK